MLSALMEFGAAISARVSKYKRMKAVRAVKKGKRMASKDQKYAALNMISRGVQVEYIAGPQKGLVTTMSKTAAMVKMRNRLVKYTADQELINSVAFS